MTDFTKTVMIIETSSNVDQSVPTVEIGNLTVETAKTLLTTEEKEEVNNGATIKVYIQTGDHNNTWMWYVLMFSGMGVAMSMNLYRKKRVTR